MDGIKELSMDERKVKLLMGYMLLALVADWTGWEEAKEDLLNDADYQDMKAQIYDEILKHSSEFMFENFEEDESDMEKIKTGFLKALNEWDI